MPATFPLHASSAEIKANEDAKKRSARLASRGASCVTYNPSPQMAIALAVAGVAVSSVRADAPHSTGALLDSPGQPFGDSTYAVRQVARSMMAGTPCVLATATDSPPPAQERCSRPLAVHGRCEGLAERRAQRAKDNFEAAFADFIYAWPRQWLLHILGGANAAARTSPSAANMWLFACTANAMVAQREFTCERASSCGKGNMGMLHIAGREIYHWIWTIQSLPLSRWRLKRGASGTLVRRLATR